MQIKIKFRINNEVFFLIIIHKVILTLTTPFFKEPSFWRFKYKRANVPMNLGQNMLAKIPLFSMNHLLEIGHLKIILKLFLTSNKLDFCVIKQKLAFSQCLKVDYSFNLIKKNFKWKKSGLCKKLSDNYLEKEEKVLF